MEETTDTIEKLKKDINDLFNNVKSNVPLNYDRRTFRDLLDEYDDFNEGLINDVNQLTIFRDKLLMIEKQFKD
jgi:hypothetical protein